MTKFPGILDHFAGCELLMHRLYPLLPFAKSPKSGDLEEEFA
jgi:hypothetical protein